MGAGISEAQAYFDIAHEGAQLRALADALPWETLGIEQPRSIVVLAGDELAAKAAHAVVEVCAPLRSPVTITRALPTYVGPLDVVVLLSERGAHDELAHAASVCHSRGVSVIAAVGEGPLKEDFPASIHVVPALPMHEGPSPCRLAGTLLAVLCVGGEPVARRLHAIAERVDEELVRCAPDHDALNPAIEIAQRPGVPLHVAADSASIALASLVATLWTHTGRLSASLDGAMLGLFSQAQAPRDPFHDPVLDGPLPPEPAVIRWGVQALAESEGDSAMALMTLIARAFAATMYKPE